jgi:predicted metal-dependent hydrolase
MRRGSRRHYERHKEYARSVVHERLRHYQALYGYEYKKVFIRNTRSRWGSCSSIGNLNFNYKVALLPPALRDYVIVHELCHLQEFNHSPSFWALVARTIPEHRVLRRTLRRVPLRLIRP